VLQVPSWTETGPATEVNRGARLAECSWTYAGINGSPDPRFLYRAWHQTCPFHGKWSFGSPSDDLTAEGLIFVRPWAMPHTLSEFGKLLGAIGICEGAGGIGAIATSAGVSTWYPTLQKPSFNPPPGLFGPVWTALYALMGGSLYLIWKARERGSQVDAAEQLFAVQLALNVLWSFLFFRVQKPGLALVEIVVLWIAILKTTRAIFKVSSTAGWLMLPYLLWTSFAVVLNFSIWRLNDA
jgi:tryptophan-rich sensory protein